MNKKEKQVKQGAEKTQKRRLFTAFERNKIRWALHCYRWKEGVSWNDYHLEIRHMLGLTLNDKRLSEGKDPKRFVLDNIQPKEAKLSLYKEFLEKVAGEYIDFNDQHEFLLAVSHYMGSFSGVSKVSNVQEKLFLKRATIIEKLVYISIDEPTVFKERMVNFACFRKIGASSRLASYRFSMRFFDAEHLQNEGLSNNGVKIVQVGEYIDEVIGNISDPNKIEEYAIENIKLGVVYAIDDEYYVGIETDCEYRAQTISVNISGRWLDNKMKMDVSEGISIAESDLQGQAPISLHNRSLYLSHEIPTIQEKISKMGFIVL